MLRNLSTVGKPLMDSIVIKATYKDDEKPKEKHVQRLISAVNSGRYESDFRWGEGNGGGGGGDGMASQGLRHGNLVSAIGQRAKNEHWEVVLKCLIVVHRLLREADTSFAQQMDNCGDLLNKSAFLDQSSTYSWGQSNYIHKYCKYLAEKVYNSNLIGYAVERKVAEEGADFAKRYNHRKLREIVPRIQKQFGYLLSCELDTSEGLHPISTNSFIQLIKDGFRLHSVLSICIYNLLSSFSDCSLDEARWCLDTYRTFVDQNEVFEKWCRKGVKLNLVEGHLLPEFGNFPESLIKSLEEYVLKLERTKTDNRHVHDLKDFLDDNELQLVVEQKDENDKKTKKSSRKSKKSKKLKPQKSSEQDDLIYFDPPPMDQRLSPRGKQNLSSPKTTKTSRQHVKSDFSSSNNNSQRDDGGAFFDTSFEDSIFSQQNSGGGGNGGGAAEEDFLTSDFPVSSSMLSQSSSNSRSNFTPTASKKTSNSSGFEVDDLAMIVNLNAPSGSVIDSHSTISTGRNSSSVQGADDSGGLGYFDLTSLDEELPIIQDQSHDTELQHEESPTSDGQKRSMSGNIVKPKTRRKPRKPVDHFDNLWD